MHVSLSTFFEGIWDAQHIFGACLVHFSAVPKLGREQCHDAPVYLRLGSSVMLARCLLGPLELP